MWKSFAMPVIVVLAMTSCTWVALTHQGDNVRLVSVSDAQGCKSIGRTQVSVRDYLVDGISRDERKVDRELTTLGRNSAAEMGGDTITPASAVINGGQAFDVYKCMP